MRYERHKNGGGKLTSAKVLVDPNSFVDRRSYVGDVGDVWESDLRTSRVTGYAIIREARLLRTKVDGGVLVKSDLSDCRVLGAPMITGAVIDRSTIRGGNIRGVIPENPKEGFCFLHDCLVEGGVIVGQPHLYGIHVHSNMRIGTGVWRRPPRYLHMDISENDIATIGVTESTAGYAYIGCKRKPMRVWQKKQNLWQKVGRWSDEMRDAVYQIFEQWQDEPLPGVKA